MLTRRAFLGFVGSGVILAAADADFWPLLIPVRTRAQLIELQISAEAEGIYSLARAESPDQPLLLCGLGVGGWLRWVESPGGEISLPQGIASLVVEGPAIERWVAIWRDEEGRIFCTRETGTVPFDA